MKPYYERDGVTIYHGDCREVLADLDVQATTCLTDPPYGLEFMGRGWDKGVPGRGFWLRILRRCAPGAMLLAFGGTRLWHRLAVAIEDAGWEVRDTIMWLYGSGFPKSEDISKAIDKKKGAKRKVVGQREVTRDLRKAGAPINGGSRGQGYGKNNRSSGTTIPVTAPATEEAALWDGWGTALKPAVEIIGVAMRPLDGTFAENALKHGVAGLNIDGARIGATVETWPATGAVPSGRWPANVVLDEDAAAQLDAQSGITKTRPSPDHETINGTPTDNFMHSRVTRGTNLNDEGGASRFFFVANYTKVERVFCLAKALIDDLNLGMRGSICDQSGASSAGLSLSLPSQFVVSALSGAAIAASQGAVRLSGLSGLSTSVTANAYALLLETLITVILSIVDERLPEPLRDVRIPNGCRVRCAAPTKQTDTMMITIDLPTFTGSVVPVTLSVTQMNKDHGDRGSERSRFNYIAKASRRERGEGNDHPTVKPLALMKYLCVLTNNPTGGLVLDPFVGSGSTLIAARACGRPAIGIEQDEHFCEIAARRLDEQTED